MIATIGLATVVAVGGACSQDDAGGPSATSRTDRGVSDSAAAAAVCQVLRDWENDLVDSINETAATVTASNDPGTRATAIQRGFDELLDLTDTLQDPVRALDLPADARWAALRADLLEGPTEARRELLDERTALEAVGPIADDDERGRVGQFFNAAEKVFSVVEPALAGYADPAMRAAFAGLADCDHVVQS